MNEKQPVVLTLADFILLPLMVCVWAAVVCLQGFRELRQPLGSPPGPFEREYLLKKKKAIVVITPTHLS